MGSVRSVVYARFRSPIECVAFAVNLLSRNGSPGCSLCSEHEASNFPHFPASFARNGRSRLLARITMVAIGRRMGQRNRATQAKSEPLLGLATRRESSNVCVWRVPDGYEAPGIGGQIRKTRTGIEGPGNARRRRAEGALAQPLWHEGPSEDSPLSTDRSGCPPNAGKRTGRTQIFGPPPSNAGRQRHSDLSTITGSPEPTS